MVGQGATGRPNSIENSLHIFPLGVETGIMAVQLLHSSDCACHWLHKPDVSFGSVCSIGACQGGITLNELFLSISLGC